MVIIGGCHVHLLENGLYGPASGAGATGTSGVTPPPAPPGVAHGSGIDWPTIIGGLTALAATAWVQHRTTMSKVKTIVDTRKPSSRNGAK